MWRTGQGHALPAFQLWDRVFFLAQWITIQKRGKQTGKTEKGSFLFSEMDD